MPTAEPAPPALKVFAALADGTRLRVLGLVGDEGPMSATELSRRLPISRQAVTKHLVALQAAGLVESRREGRATRYRATTEPLGQAERWLADAGGRWDRRLAALQRRLADRSSGPTGAAGPAGR